MSRNSHDGARAVAGKYIIAHPNRDFLTREGIYGIAAREYARYFLLNLALALCLVLHLVEIGVDCRFLLRSGKQGNIF